MRRVVAKEDALQDTTHRQVLPQGHFNGQTRHAQTVAGANEHPVALKNELRNSAGRATPAHRKGIGRNS